MGDAVIMEDRRLTDVSNPTFGTCEGTVIIKTEPVEYDEQVNVWGKTHTKTVNEKEAEVVPVKTKTDNMENGLEYHSRVEIMNRNIQKNISDHLIMDENGLENFRNKPKSQHEADNKPKEDISVVIKTEDIEEEDQYGCVLDKVNTANVTNLGKIDSLAVNMATDVDCEEQVIVLNKNTKFKNSSKPDTSAYSQICQICDMAFRWPQQLKDHINFVHEGNFPYTCQICGRRFEKSRLLKVHKYVHTEERPHSCKLCPKSFKRRADLTRHIRGIHGENNLIFKCKHCSQVFKCKDDLVSHFAVHQGGQKFVCEVCDKEFIHRKSLKNHLVTHSGEKNFECTECGMKFQRKDSLKVHQLNHLEVKPYQCHFCDKSFSCNPNLKRHLQLHTGERPHKCQYCDKSFTQLVTLKIHEKRHRGEKDFECGICGKGFVMRNNLTNHMRIHTGERPYKCELCPYTAKVSSALKDHMKVHSEESPFKCEICPYTAKRLSNLLCHERKHEREAPNMEAEMRGNGTGFKSESATEDDEAMRENSNEDTDTEVNDEALPLTV